MEKHCGMLERVGDLTGGELYVPVDRDGNVQVGAFRAATQVDSIKITKTYLRNSMLQLATIFAFMYGLGGTFVGGFVGGILGATMAPVVATLALAFLFFRRRACRQL